MRSDSFRSMLRLIATTAMLGVTVACGDVGSENATLGEPTEKNAPTTKFKVGDIVNFETFEVVLENVEERSTVGSEYSKEKAAEGGTYVAVVYTLKNTGKKPIGMFDGPTLKLMDASGTTYDADLGASTSFSLEKDLNRKVLSDLNPGIKTKDGKVFEVSKEQFDRAAWKIVLDGHEDTPIALN